MGLALPTPLLQTNDLPINPKPPQPTKNKQYKERESQVHEVEVARAGRSLSPPKRDTNRGLLGGAPVARERWIGGWEAAALARRLLVLNSAVVGG